MPPGVFSEQAKLLHKNSANDSIYSYWNLMVSRALKDEKGFLRIENTQRDYGFFYQEFHNYKKTH
jgi:hypothetical protein